MNKIFDVIGIGGAAWDFLGILKEYPYPGEKSEIMNFNEQGGGQVGTATVTVARLGGKSAIIGVTGDDNYGGKIRHSFITEGVDTTYLLTDPGKTSHVAFCMIPEETGNRAIFYSKGTKRLLTPEDLPMEILLNCKCLLLDTHHGLASIKGATVCKDAGIPVVTDIERNTEYNDQLFQKGTHHILPERYLLDYTGEKDSEKAVSIFRKEYKPQVMVITMGEKGSRGYMNNEVICEPPYTIEKTVDTTGAGDVFHGTFAYGITLGYNLRKNLKFSSLVAGLKCRHLGGRAGIPRKEEVNKYMRIANFHASAKNIDCEVI